jgi:predicted HTH domain antitoxin
LQSLLKLEVLLVKEGSFMTLTIELPAELVDLLGTEEEAKQEVKTALILDLVRRGKISRAKAAELLQLSLWDLPSLLAQYRIPWFDYSEKELEKDLETLRSKTDPTE